MSACFCPDHKAPMVLFLDRVYGIEDQSFLLQLLEVGFLPDLRASASLDTVSAKKHPNNFQYISLATFTPSNSHLDSIATKAFVSIYFILFFISVANTFLTEIVFSFSNNASARSCAWAPSLLIMLCV